MPDMEGYVLDGETGEITWGLMEAGVAWRSVPARCLPDEWAGEIVYARSSWRSDVNSLGKSDDDVRKFIREMGYQPNAARVDVIGREIRRTEAENARVEARAKELGGPKLTDARGRDALKVAKEAVTKRANAGKPPPRKMEPR